MAYENGGEFVRLWKEGSQEGPPMTLQEIRTRASKLERRASRRNIREYIAALIVVLAFALLAWIETDLAVRAGDVLAAAAAVWVVHHLHRRGSVRPLPSDTALFDCLVFHRRELIRQRDLLRSVWWWYLLSFVPSVTLIQIGRAIARPDQGWQFVATAAFIAASFAFIAAANRRAAEQLQERIDELDGVR
jgi:cytochrome bd-type quinol oxidase subunit 2